MEGQIQYVQQIVDTKKKGYKKMISYDVIDENKEIPLPFIECIEKPQYVHLYFDFDSIKTKEEYLNVIEWLDSLTDVFGKYTIGGYTNDKSLFDQFKYIPLANHTLSIHVN